MRLAEFDFNLPDQLIAQRPLAERDASRMMVLDRQRGCWEHRAFRDLPDLLGHSFLVVNRTRVLPARIWARRPDRHERIELLLLEERGEGVWEALARPARKVPLGSEILIGALRARCVGVLGGGERRLQFSAPAEVRPYLERHGAPPLPPYIRRAPSDALDEDRERYQTIFAQSTGSVAAPTAALHFTPATLAALHRRNIPLCEILLHVGYGTFQPMRSETVETHRMHREYFEIPPEAAVGIQAQRGAGRRLVAVGTTTTRALEHAARLDGGFPRTGSAGWCDLFITPGFRFQMLDGLLTNFHLPRSSLLVLVSAFAGIDLVRDAYREAVREGYRFFSYGDCMLIL